MYPRSVARLLCCAPLSERGVVQHWDSSVPLTRWLALAAAALALAATACPAAAHASTLTVAAVPVALTAAALALTTAAGAPAAAVALAAISLVYLLFTSCLPLVYLLFTYLFTLCLPYAYLMFTSYLPNVYLYKVIDKKARPHEEGGGQKGADAGARGVVGAPRKRRPETGCENRGALEVRACRVKLR